MKVYNCFQMYNELDLVEIRIQENWDVTDYFVISESNYTHAGNPKPYYLLENWDRFKRYESKIRRIQVDESLEQQKKVFPFETDEWVREKYQRFALHRGLIDLQSDDLIVISDCDEIPRAELIQLIKEDQNDYDRYICKIVHFHFRLNYMRILPKKTFEKIIVVRGRSFTNPMQEREYTFGWVEKPENTVIVDHGGWHWSDFGDDQHVINKLKNFCHLDQNNEKLLMNINLQYLIKNKYDRDNTLNPRFEYVIIDDYFPKCITDNLDKYNNMIIPNAKFRVTDFYGV